MLFCIEYGFVSLRLINCVRQSYLSGTIQTYIYIPKVSKIIYFLAINFFIQKSAVRRRIWPGAPNCNSDRVQKVQIQHENFNKASAKINLTARVTIVKLIRSKDGRTFTTRVQTIWWLNTALYVKKCFWWGSQKIHRLASTLES